MSAPTAFATAAVRAKKTLGGAPAAERAVLGFTQAEDRSRAGP